MIRELEKWLIKLLPVEQCCKSFYLKYGNITLGDYYHLKSKALWSDVKHSVFCNLDNTYCPTTPKLDKYGNATTFTNDIWFGDDPVLVRKHTRYFPKALFQMQSIDLSYMLSGQCIKTITLRNRTEVLQLNTGDICIIPPMVQQCDEIFQDEGIMLIFSIRQDILASLMNDFLPDLHFFPFFSKVALGRDIKDYMILSSKDDKNIRDAFLTIALEYCLKKTHWKKIIVHQLGLIFSYLQREHFDTCRYSIPKTNEFDHISGFLSYIQYHFSDFSLPDMGEFFHLSPNYICKLYKKQMGCTITQTLQNVRVSKAKTLLETTNFPVWRIAQMIGYEDTTYFIRIFKKTVGTTPLQYRILTSV